MSNSPTPHSNTDVDRLFGELGDAIRAQGLLPKYQSHFRSARERHDVLRERILHDTKDDIQAHLNATGFAIENEDWRTDHYAGAVVIVRARRV